MKYFRNPLIKAKQKKKKKKWMLNLNFNKEMLKKEGKKKTFSWTLAKESGLSIEKHTKMTCESG